MIRALAGMLVGGIAATGGLVVAQPISNQPNSPPDVAEIDRQQQEQESIRLWNEARRLRDAGKPTEGLSVARQAIAIEQKLFGPDSKELISTWNLIATCAENARDWQPAAEARDQALRIAGLIYGPDDWHTIDARQSVATLSRLKELSEQDSADLQAADKSVDDAIRLSNEGKYGDAAALAEQALAVRQRLLGPNHPDTAVVLNNLAYCRRMMGKYADAEAAALRASEIWVTALGLKHPLTATGYDSLAQLYKAQGKFAAAEDLFKRSLAIREQAYGPDNTDVASSCNNLAMVYDSQAKYADAEALYRRAIAIWEKQLGPEHRYVATGLGNLAMLYSAQGRFAESESLYQRALTINEKVLGPDHPDMAYVLNNFANLYRTQGKFAEAEPLYRRALEIRERSLGAMHPLTATSLGNLAEFYRVQGKYAAALPLFQRALAINEQILGPDHRDTTVTLNNLALLYQAQGNLAAAEPLFKRAIAAQEKTLGPDDPGVAIALCNLALLYEAKGDYAAAEPLLTRGLKIAETKLGPDHFQTAWTVQSLGSLYQHQGNYAAAETMFSRAIKSKEQVFGPDHPDTAAALRHLGELYRTQGNFAAAEPILRRALAIWEKSYGLDNPITARALSSLAFLYLDQGNTTAAEPLMKQALEIQERLSGPDNPIVARCLNDLALLYKDQGSHAQSVPLYERARAIQEKAYGSESPDLAGTLHNLAFAYSQMGKFREAEPLYLRSLAIHERMNGPDSPETAICLSNLALMYSNMGNAAAAQKHAGRALDIDLASLERSASVQTEQQQFDMVTSVASLLNIWMNVTANDPAAAAETWQRVLAWKGITTTRQIAMRQAMKNDPTYAEFQRVSQKLSTVSLNPPKVPTTGGSAAELSQRAVELRKAWQEQRAALEADFEQLEKQLAQKSAVFHQQHERRTVRPAAVIASLKQAPRATALVDILEYEHFADLGTKNSGEQRVAAFVIESDGQIHRVELGPARPIHDAILAWRESYGGARLNQNPGQVLRQLLWTPLEGYLKQADTVLISPDGPLAQLPWAALPGRNPSTYLIEERAIAVVPIPQILPELLREAPHDEAPDSLLVAGDIAYGGDAGSSSDLLAQRSAVGRERGGNWLQFSELPNAASELKSILGGYEQVKQRAHVDVLERQDATEEAFREQAPIHAWVHLVTHGFFAPAELNARLATSAPAAPAAPAQANLGQAIAGVGAVFVMRNGHCLVDRLFTDGAADKDGRLQAGDELIAVAQAGGQWVDVQDKELQQVLSMTRGPAGAAVRLRVRPQANPDRVIELELVRAVLPTSAAAQRPPPTNPGLLSGLAFAGSNKPPENGHDDGILTAMEVASLDLSQVDTVVLSACETGLGEVAGGEGLLGLQRAFEVAGAKTVVASLWKVPDRATQMLMTRFYQNLWQKKMPKLDALREAQLWMLRDVPKDQELLAQANRGVDIDAPAEKPDSSSLSPRYWAAFVLSGDWR